MITKYRAWVKKYKKMCPVIDLDFSRDGSQTLLGVGVLINPGHLDMVTPDKVKLMQSTGLKDKKGKIYYQDDLVKYENKVYRLVLGTYQFELVGFYNSYQDIPWDFFSEGAYLQADIIGNIWENPELLEGESE